MLEGLVDVRFGSLADIMPLNCDVRFTPGSGHCLGSAVVSSTATKSTIARRNWNPA